MQEVMHEAFWVFITTQFIAFRLLNWRLSTLRARQEMYAYVLCPIWRTNYVRIKRRAELTAFPNIRRAFPCRNLNAYEHFDTYRCSKMIDFVAPINTCARMINCPNRFVMCVY